uniref:Retrovirus-related Pol polyprotein from transposon TNT 1-94 n=1 Tax=Cajanus cajan TaxID=3821 RepID=A0A151SIT0_CAJCA|nr:Retrovirus-related Pol polyprotein from transposon TNT 1-94 [Cajanus cajan]
MRSVDAPFWKEAINDEINSLKINKTWFLTDFPPGCKSIGCKWVFRTDGFIDKFKARPVVIGYKQVEGVDFFDTYSPVCKVTTIRVLIALACVSNLKIHQMDVKTVFLNSDLEEEIYINQLEGFIEPGMENKVCKLVKSLYGLKQAPKQCHDKFDQVVSSYGFQFNNSDKCVYVKQFDDNSCVILCLYVDDILIFGSNLHVINDVKSFLSSNFEMKDLGLVDVILGIKLIKNHNGIVLTQSHYIEKY